MVDKLFTPEEIETEIKRILDTTYDYFGVDADGIPRTLRWAINCGPGEYMFYFGKTYRTLTLEGLRWLTTRGLTQGGGNRPVLTWPDGRTITQKQARELLGEAAMLLQ